MLSWLDSGSNIIDVLCVFEVLKCDRVNQRGSHNKIHHTEEDLGKLVVNLNSYKLNLVVKSVDALLFLFLSSEEGCTESQRGPQEESFYRQNIW